MKMNSRMAVHMIVNEMKVNGGRFRLAVQSVMGIGKYLSRAKFIRGKMRGLILQGVVSKGQFKVDPFFRDQGDMWDKIRRIQASMNLLFRKVYPFSREGKAERGVQG